MAKLKPKTVFRKLEQPPGVHNFSPFSRVIRFLSTIKTHTMEWTKKTWQIVLVITIANMLLSAVITFTVNAFSFREEALQGAASITYVDKKDTDQKMYIDIQDNSAINRMDRIQLQVNTKADKDDFDKLWNLAIENNKLLIQVYKEVKTLK